MEGLRVLVLYVTVEQETAITALFNHHKWSLDNKADVLYASLQNGNRPVQSPEQAAWTKLLEQTSTSTPSESDNSDHVPQVITNCVNSDSDSAQTGDTVINGQPEIAETPTRQSLQQLYSGMKTRQTHSKQINNKTESTCTKVDKARPTCENVKSSLANTRVDKSRQSGNSERKLRPTRRKLKTDDINHIDNAQDLQSETDKTLNIKQVKLISGKRSRPQHLITNVEAGPQTRKAEAVDDSNTSEIREDETNSNDRISLGGSPSVCKLCGYTSTYKNYLRHVRTVHTSTRHPCRHCSKSFKCGYEARMHERHAHEKVLKCGTCNKEFKSRSGFINHNKQAHLNQPLYRCGECEATFLYKQHYLGHMNKHRAQKPFTCPRCEQTFRYKTSLNTHQTKCNGTRRDSEQLNRDGNLKTTPKQKSLCDICGSTFSSKDSLKTHHRQVHKEMPKAECFTCGKQFKTVQNLKRHERVIHTETDGLPCEVCGRFFSQATVLREHLKRHKQEFSVYCETCGKGFYSNFKLREHERSHTGEKPYKCPVCTGFSCASKNNLHKHMRLHERGTKRGRLPRKKTAKVGSTAKQENSSVTGLSDKRTSRLPLVEGKHNAGDTSILSEALYENSGNDYAQMVVNNRDVMSAHDSPGNHGNMVAMTAANDVRRYSYEHYGQGSVIPVQEGSYDPRVLNNSYHDNTIVNESSDHMSQGLNILTVAMNIVNPVSYGD